MNFLSVKNDIGFPFYSMCVIFCSDRIGVAKPVIQTVFISTVVGVEKSVIEHSHFDWGRGRETYTDRFQFDWGRG